MFDRFTECCRVTMRAARAAALALDHSRIGSEHILIGLLDAEGPVHGATLEATTGRTRDELRALAVERAGPAAPRPASRGQLPFTPCGKRVLELTAEACTRLGSTDVRCEHLLLGLAAETEGRGGALLRELGASPVALEAALQARWRPSPPAALATAPATPVAVAAPAASDVPAQLFELALACRALQQASDRQEARIVALRRALDRALLAGGVAALAGGGLLVALLARG